MRILFVGDVFGRSGRDALKEHLPKLKEQLSPDVIIINVDNAASGRGVNKDIAKEIFGYGADCLTGGDHIWDQREMVCVVENNTNIIRPFNLPKGTPGKGVWRKTLLDGSEIVVLHICGRLFMNKTFDNPFLAADEALKSLPPCQGTSRSIFVDFHAEATSEKMAMGHYLDGRVAAVVGTHTHVPTADAQILPKGTALQSDAGMCGDYNSIIGANPEQPIHNFLQKVPQERMVPTVGEATLCGTLIETNNKTGLAKNIAPIRIGGRLRQEIPDF